MHFSKVNNIFSNPRTVWNSLCSVWLCGSETKEEKERTEKREIKSRTKEDFHKKELKKEKNIYQNNLQLNRNTGLPPGLSAGGGNQKDPFG